MKPSSFNVYHFNGSLLGISLFPEPRLITKMIQGLERGLNSFNRQMCRESEQKGD